MHFLIYYVATQILSFYIKAVFPLQNSIFFLISFDDFLINLKRALVCGITECWQNKFIVGFLPLWHYFSFLPVSYLKLQLAHTVHASIEKGKKNGEVFIFSYLLYIV